MRPSIAIQWGEAPSRATFDEALEMGLIAPISSFTTEYNDSPATANRRHNIHHGGRLAEQLHRPGRRRGVVVQRHGRASANEEAGLPRRPHAIINGEYDDAIGGGICQVATTVFNAVYEAGYPVTERATTTRSTSPATPRAATPPSRGPTSTSHGSMTALRMF